jgi:hypothetical protein
MKTKTFNRNLKSRKRLGREFSKLEKRLRRITTESELKIGKFVRTQSKELARKTQSVINRYHTLKRGM